MLVRLLQESCWHDPIDASAPISPDNLHGDIAKNFNCSESCLSFFRAASDEDVEAIAIAVAAGRKSIDDVHCCLIDETNLTREGLSVDTVPGETLFSDVNDQHVDVGGLNLEKLASLATICAASGKTTVIHAKVVKSALAQRLLEGAIEPNHLNPKLLESIEAESDKIRKQLERAKAKAERDAQYANR